MSAASIARFLEHSRSSYVADLVVSGVDTSEAERLAADQQAEAFPNGQPAAGHLVMEVIGRRSVTIVDGAASETDAWEVRAHRPLMISGVVLHSLPAGYRFDLRRRERVATPSLHALPGAEAASS